MTLTKKTQQTAKIHRLQFVHRDRGYRFQDRDPAMEELCGLIHASELDVKAIVSAVSRATGGAYTVSNSTIYNWLSGQTKRPQSFTMNWVGYALGYERKWTKMS